MPRQETMPPLSLPLVIELDASYTRPNEKSSFDLITHPESVPRDPLMTIQNLFNS